MFKLASLISNIDRGIYHAQIQIVLQRSYYQTTKERDLKNKKFKFPQKTQEIYTQDKEVKTCDGFSLIEPLVDKNQKPHELHLIKKIGKLVGEPWWIKDAMVKLGFKAYMSREWTVIYNIQPNTVEVNKMLMLCKHVVKVLPVKFLNRFPTEKDIGNTRLNLETGELSIVKSLVYSTFNDNIKYYTNNGVNISTDIKPSDSFPLDKIKMREHLQRRRQLLRLNDEYFAPNYSYKYDQDKPGVIKVPGRPNSSVKEDDVTDN
jgi:hypothetical protein